MRTMRKSISLLLTIVLLLSSLTPFSFAEGVQQPVMETNEVVKGQDSQGMKEDATDNLVGDQSAEDPEEVEASTPDITEDVSGALEEDKGNESNEILKDEGLVEEATEETEKPVRSIMPTSIIGGGNTRSIIQPEVFVHTYTFMLDGKKYEDETNPQFNPQIIKNGEKLFEPKAPYKEEKYFVGWFDGENKIDFSKPITVRETKDIALNAKFANGIRVLFSVEGKVVYTKSVEPGKPTDDKDVHFIIETPGQVFSHWVDENGEVFDFTKNIEKTTRLYAVLKTGHKITFKTHGGSAIGMKIVKDGDTVAAEGIDNNSTKKAGYEFSHWALEENGEAYDLSAPVSKDLELHAVWKPGIAPYTVVYWQENPNDDGYSYVETEPKEGATETETVFTTKVYDGFKLNNEKSKNEIIKGDGSTLVNVYYDRDRYSLEFREVRGNSAILDLKFEDIKWGASTDKEWETANQKKPGYTWSEQRNGSAPWYSGAPDMPKKNLVLYGRQWGKATFVVFYRDNNTNEIIRPSFSFKHENGTMYTTKEDYIAIPGFEVIIPQHNPNNTKIEPFKYNYNTGQYEVTIKYNRLSYKISYTLNDGSGKIVTSDPILFNADISDKALANYIPGTTQLSDGSTFEGWYDNAGLAGEAYSFEGKKMPPNNLLLYAKWKAPVHEVRAHKTIEIASDYYDEGDQYVTHGEAIPGELLDKFDNYREKIQSEDDFVAWYYTADDVFTPFDFATPIIRDVDIYPVYKKQIHKVTFELSTEGETGEAPVFDEDYVKGTYAKLPSPTGIIPPKDKVFLGWKVKGADPVVIYQPGGTILMDSDKVIIPHWGIAGQYTFIRYNANGGSGEDVIIRELRNNDVHTVLNNNTRNEGTNFTRDGFTFAGWNTEPHGRGASYQPGDIIRLDTENAETENVLYAQWRRSVMAEKRWLGGGPEEKPTVYFQLWRRVLDPENNAANLVNELVEGAELKELAHGTTTVTWMDLDEFYVPEGEGDVLPWIYYVKETDKEGNNFTPDNYYKKEMSSIDSKPWVENIYCKPITITKEWKGGTKPNTVIELWKKVDEKEEKVGEFTATPNEPSYTFKRVLAQNNEGKPYEFIIKEPKPGANYSFTSEKNEDDLTITFTALNTYTIPKDGYVAADKKWVGDEKVERPTLLYTLYRKIEGGEYEAVKVDQKEITATNISVEWSDLEETDIDGNPYEFTVKESVKTPAPTDANWIFGEEFEWPTEGEGNRRYTNTAIDPEKEGVKLTIKKVLENEPVEAMSRSYRQEPIAFGFTVTGPYGFEEKFSLRAGEDKVLENLYYGEYTIEETEAHGYTPTYSETGGKVTLSKENKEATITVTNKNIIGPDNPNIVDITVNKEWINGAKPDTVLELWRKGKDANGEAIDEKMGEFTANGTTTSHTFEGLAKHDPSGRKFTYYAKEPEVPKNYTADRKGLTVINTYSIPKNGSFEATKIWTGDEKVARPHMNFTLYRTKSVEGKDIKEVVPGTETQKNPQVVTPEKPTASWSDLEETDIDGNEYTFSVEESFVEDLSSNDNWVMGNYDKKTKSITNRVINNNDPDNPEIVGKLVIEKAKLKQVLVPGIEGSSEEQVKFHFVVKGDNEFEEEFELAPGEKKEFTGLYYGEYTVTETDTSGFVAQYKPGATVHLVREKPEATVLVENLHQSDPSIEPGVDPDDDPNLVKFVARKEWVNGPKEDHKPVELELYRSIGSTKQAVAVDPVITGENAFTYTWSGLDKYNAEGYLYTYSVEEVGEKDGKVQIGEHTYSVQYEKDGDVQVIKNTYVIPTKEKLEAKKIWKNAPDKKPIIRFKLLRKIEGGSEEAVPGAAIQILDKVEVVSWENIELTDLEGRPYIFRVMEVNDKGESYTPEGYKKTEDGLTVTNTYIVKDAKKLPQTGRGNDWYLIGGGVFILIGLLIMGRKKKNA